MQTQEERIERLKREHAREFGSRAADLKAVIAPFRICPLGAHVDHQHGLVTGMALENSITLVFEPNPEGRVRLRSLNFPKPQAFSVREPFARAHDWGDYARGAALALTRARPLETGINGVLHGDMPIGGLSSSAACGVAYLLALEYANGISADAVQNIEHDRVIENEFIGLNNGILDQSVILLAHAQRLLSMDCQSGSFKLVEPVTALPPFDILVVYSGVAKKLENTDYNKRVRECETAARRILELAGRPAPDGQRVRLRQVKPAEYIEHGHALEPNLQKRVEHFFTECARVQEGRTAWATGNLVHLGWLMMESGVSSIENYECGCPPMITLTEILNQTPGVYGARFSGAGFRGCCIGLSDPSRRDAIRDAIATQYPPKHPEFADACEVHFCRMGHGARIV